MTTWSFQSLTPHESIIPLSKLVIRKISHKTSECSCILTSFSPPKQFESVTFPTKKNKFTLTLCERCCCFATFFGSWFVQVLRTSVPRRVSHLGSKDRRMVCKATRGVYGCCTLECSIGIKKEGHIYIYTLYTVYIYTDVYITSFWNVLSMPGKWEHIFRRIWRFFFSSFGVNTFGCAIEVVAGSQFAAPLVEVLFRFRPCRWWKMPNQKTAFWRILNGQRWSQRESSTWQEWRIHAWALFMSRLKAFVLKYTSRIIIQQIYRYWNMK